MSQLSYDSKEYERKKWIIFKETVLFFSLIQVLWSTDSNGIIPYQEINTWLLNDLVPQYVITHFIDPKSDW